MSKYHPSGQVFGETAAERGLQNIQEATRFLVDYAKAPAVAAALVTAAYPTYKKIKQVSENAQDAARIAFNRAKDEESSYDDPIFGRIADKYGEKVASASMHKLEDLWAKHKERPRMRVVPRVPGAQPTKLSEVIPNLVDGKNDDESILPPETSYKLSQETTDFLKNRRQQPVWIPPRFRPSSQQTAADSDEDLRSEIVYDGYDSNPEWPALNMDDFMKIARPRRTNPVQADHHQESPQWLDQDTDNDDVFIKPGDD